ncbi:MAG: glycosyltransferase family 4 protein [Athalassotoga sp.]
MIAEICDYAAEYSGNFISSLLNLAQKVRSDLKMETLFVFPKESENKQWIKLIDQSGFKVVFVDRNSSLRDQKKFFRELAEKYGIKLMHTHFVKFDIPVLQASKKSNLHVIWHVHNDLTHNNVKQRVKDFIKFRIMSKNVDKIICVSEPVKQNLIKRGSSSDKTIAVKNGIDVERIDKKLQEINRDEIRKRFDFSTSDFVITLFGWDPYRKGVDIAIEAGKILEKAGIKNFKFLIVGRDELRKFVGDAINFKWLKLSEPSENVAIFYKISDIFLSASRIEGLPYSVGEAMISQLSVISSDIPYVVENFRDAGDGFIVFKNGDPEDLSMKIKDLMNLSSESLRDMGRKNRDFILKNLSIDEWSKQILNIYKFILKADDR